MDGLGGKEGERETAGREKGREEESEGEREGGWAGKGGGVMEGGRAGRLEGVSTLPSVVPLTPSWKVSGPNIMSSCER